MKLFLLAMKSNATTHFQFELHISCHPKANWFILCSSMKQECTRDQSSELYSAKNPLWTCTVHQDYHSPSAVGKKMPEILLSFWKTRWGTILQTVVFLSKKGYKLYWSIRINIAISFLMFVFLRKTLWLMWEWNILVNFLCVSTHPAINRLNKSNVGR